MKSIVIALLLMATIAGAQQSARVVGPVEAYNITSFPLYGRLLTPSDQDALPIPGFVRADTAGSVKVQCQLNTAGETITLALVAGEFVPCRVIKVWDAGTTDGITLHLFY